MKQIIICALLLTLTACSATPTRRAFKEGWRDSNITSTVKWKLTRDKTVKARNIDVDTWRGLVTLSGRMVNETEKAQAEKIAGSVKNVKQVRNLIDIVGVESVPQKVVKENVPFSKPAGKFEEPKNIALPTIDDSKTAKQQNSTVANTAPAVSEKDLTEKAPVQKHENAVSHEITKELAVAPPQDDVTLQAEQELKELKTKKGK